MNNGIRILIERRIGGRWHYQLNCYGDEHLGRHTGEVSATKAVEQAEAHLMQIDLARHYKQRTA